MTSRGRLSARLACFAVAAGLLWPVMQWPAGSKAVPETSPFVSVCSLLAGHTFGIGTGIGLAVAAATIFRKRWFCRYICPAGFLQDGAGRIGLHKVSWRARFPSIGRYIVILTAACSLAGYPLFLWMDPLALFSSAVTAHAAAGIRSGMLLLTGMAALLVTALIFGDLWCARICPLGASQEMLSGVKSLPARWRRGRRLQAGTDHGKGIGDSASRRAFLTFAAGVGLGFGARRIGAARENNRLLRPPGASSEDVFTGLCIRCGNCIRSCPSGILHPDLGSAGVLGFLAPVIRYESQYCLETCNACCRTCPSGALDSLDPERKRRYLIGEARVDGSLCHLVRGVSDCDICVRSCPYGAVEIYWNENLYVAYPVVDASKCNGCGACEAYCPTGRIKAIQVWNTPRTI